MSTNKTAARTLIRGGAVYDRAGDIHRPAIRDVIVEGSRIVSVTAENEPAALELAQAAERGEAGVSVIDARGKLVIPGSSTRITIPTTCFRKGASRTCPSISGCCIRSLRSGASAALRSFARARCSERWRPLRHGITTIQDMNSLVPQDEETLDIILSAYEEVDIRVVFSIAVRDLASLDIEPFMPANVPEKVKEIIGGKPGDAKADIAFIRAQLARRNPLPPRLHWAIGPSGPQGCSQELLEGLAAVSDEFNLPVLTHL